MKILFVLAAVVACTEAGSLSNIGQKLIPSFTKDFVIKGEDAKPNSAPYIASLSRTTNHSHICGGTIIAKSWILTAAHCISTAKGMGVLAGLHHRLNSDNNTQSREVDWGKVHEKYAGRTGPYDIAILHLSVPLEINKYVQPASLPAIDEISSGSCHLYGWGQAKPFSFSASKTLQTVDTYIMDFNECVEALPANAPIHETNLCTDSLKKGISACNGDSGGPLVIEHENATSELIGIVSWGYIPCGVAQMPSIFTRVSAFIDWIPKIQNAYYVLY